MRPSAPGWYPDPTGRHERRYWSGFRWTRHVADGRRRGEDPLAVEREGGAAGPADPEPSRPGLAVQTRRTGAPEHAAAPREQTTPADGMSWGEERPGRGRWLMLGAAVAVLAVLAGAFLVLRGDGDGDQAGTTETRNSGNDDPLEAYLVDFNLRASSNTVSEDQANCMADNTIAIIGRDRLMEAGVMQQDSPFEALTTDEIVRSINGGFDCLEDEDIVEYLAATWNPERFGGIPDAVAPCLFRGWLQGWGRRRVGEIVGQLVIPDNAPELADILTPAENETLVTVLTACMDEYESTSSTAPP